VYKRVAVYDASTSATELESQAVEIVNFISKGLHHGSVLVHCNHGVSRSTTCILLYLMRCVLFIGVCRVFITSLCSTFNSRNVQCFDYMMCVAIILLYTQKDRTLLGGCHDISETSEARSATHSRVYGNVTTTGGSVGQETKDDILRVVG
jgi:hypothetical protein